MIINKINNYFKSFYIVLLYIVTGILTYGNHEIMIPLVTIGTFFISFFVLKKYDFIKNFILLIVPILVLIFITSVINYDFLRSIFYLIFIPIASFLGYLYKIKKNIIIPIAVIIFSLVIGLYIYPNYFVYFINKGARKNTVSPKFELIDRNKKQVKFTKNIIVLDFWTTSCGVCFKKFPELEKIYLAYKNNDNIAFYSVNIPLKRDNFNKTLKMVDSMNYKFSTIYALPKDNIQKKLNINAFPHLIIIKNDSIRYSGRLVTEKNVFVNNITSEINRLVK